MELVSPIYFDIMAIVAIVAGLAIAAWWIVTLYWIRSRDMESRLPVGRLPDGLSEASAGVPPALIILYIVIALSMIGYVLYCWLGGVTY